VLGGDPDLAPDIDDRDAQLFDQPSNGPGADLQLLSDLLDGEQVEALGGRRIGQRRDSLALAVAGQGRAGKPVPWSHPFMSVQSVQSNRGPMNSLMSPTNSPILPFTCC
jgi:hypothetical protein